MTQVPIGWIKGHSDWEAAWGVAAGRRHIRVFGTAVTIDLQLITRLKYQRVFGINNVRKTDAFH